jgi:hypothetical protein
MLQTGYRSPLNFMTQALQKKDLLRARGGSFHRHSLIREPNSLPDDIASQDLKQTLLLGLAKRFKGPIHTKPEFVCNKGFD